MEVIKEVIDKIILDGLKKLMHVTTNELVPNMVENQMGASASIETYCNK
jgi:hypothetical protein